jgi:urea transport system permease protein
MKRNIISLVGLVGLTVATVPAAFAGPLEDGVAKLASASEDDIQEGLRRLATLDDPKAIPALEALCDDRLRAGPDGKPYIFDSKTRDLRDALTGQVVSARPSPLREVEMNNELRRVALPVLAQLQLGAPEAAVRRAAAEELAKRGSAEAAGLLKRAIEREHDGGVREALQLAQARVGLQGTDRDAKLAALEVVRQTGNDDFLADLQKLVGKGSDGRDLEPDPAVHAAAQKAMDAIVAHQRVVSLFGSLVHGISLASVLLFVALGLAVTFGLLGVINMAHGEMLMLGAYATYSVQVFFQSYLPGAFKFYLLAAIPVGFLVPAAVGVLLERTVIRHLYGRPLETLLATWGISLGLIQTVRLAFGAQNVLVANPDWLSGGVELAHGLVLPYSRIAVVGFVIVVAVSLWLLLQKTRLGLSVRAVTQNRGMAACLGIRTARIDAWMFGLGSGIAGLGGVALSQLGNVGPELGQGYIIDSFMVVVLGGVGRLAGTVAAALGLGLVNKILEPMVGAVVGKIAVLVLIIVFIQRRPQGLFALKGRVEA